jgi:hypothetical protein
MTVRSSGGRPATRRLALGLAALCAAGAGAAAAVPPAGRDAPPPGHTGGSGEPTCHECHFQAEVNQGGGAIAMTGLPEAYAPGATYPVSVTVSHPGMRTGGFQIAARFEDGTQAGHLDIPDAEAGRAGITFDGGIQYAHHLHAGTGGPPGPSTAWTLTWTAPDCGRTVAFHVAGIGADGDDSPLGDYVYTAAILLPGGDTATAVRVR